MDGKVASTTLETSGAATVGGDLTLSNTAAVQITHSGSTSLSISTGFVAVESVQFTSSLADRHQRGHDDDRLGGDCGYGDCERQPEDNWRP